MKKVLTILFLIPFALIAQDFDYSPAINRNLEILFDNYLIDYQKIINVDPNTNPIDTFGIVEVYRNANGRYFNGREFVNDSLSTEWFCSIQNGVNIIDILDLQNGSALVQKEKIHFDNSNRDTLIEIFLDTAGNGVLSKVQDFQLFYNNFGLDSAAVTVPGGGVGNEVFYSFRRDAVGRLDSLVLAITFAGSVYPIQTLIYYEGTNGLDSINLRNNLNGLIEEQVRVKNDPNDKVYEFSFYEKDMNNEWSIYETYILSTESFFNLLEDADDFKIQLYPNPASRELHLELNQEADYKVYHLSGQIIKQGHLSSEILNIADLSPGTYVLYLDLENGESASKVFKVQR